MDYHFKAGSVPLLVSMPHVGTDIPDEVAASLAPCAFTRADTDWHLAQVYAFAETLLTSLEAGKTVVTHCLAGIGRTTTMLMAAYLVQGYPLDALAAWVRVRNPHYFFHGSQFRFLQALAEDVRDGGLPVLAPGEHLPLCR